MRLRQLAPPPGRFQVSRSQPAAEPEPRFPLITSYELWRRMWWVLAYGIVVLLAGEGITIYGRHGLDPSFLVVLALFLIILGWLYLRQRWHYVSLTPEGLLIRHWFHLTTLPYESLRQARAQPLGTFFDAPSRRSLLSGSLKRYASSPVCIVRVEMDHDRLLAVGRELGRRTVLDQDLILLVRRADELDRGLRPQIRRRPPAAASRPSRRR